MLEQKFKPNKEKLKLKDIEIDISQSNPEYMDETAEHYATYPTVYYNGYKLSHSKLENFSMDFNSFIPILTFTYDDESNLLHKHGLPMDDSRLKVMFPSNNKALGNILIEFKIEAYDVYTNDAGSKSYDMVCILNNNKLLTSEYRAFVDMTSYEVFETIAKEAGLGFVTNISSTNDRMTWTNFDIRYLEFLEDVRDHAWIGESSFVWAYIDPFYNLVLVDVEKSLTSNIEDIVWSMDNTFSSENTDEEIIPGPPILTTDTQYDNTNIYVYDYYINNTSTQISLERGYVRNVHYYDIDGNWDKRAGHYHKYGLDTITTPGSESTKIIAKSDDADFYKMNDSQIYAGIIDTINVHPDYLWAKIQNEENVREMEKFILQLLLNKQNFNITRFQKIQFHDVDNQQNIDSDPYNHHLSNDYLVIGFTIEFNTNSVEMKVNVISRELQPPNSNME